MRAVEQRLYDRSGVTSRFRTSTRWTRTATNSSGGLMRGDALTLTWSIVPDGTPIEGFADEPAAPSNLKARLNAIYGSEATWRPLFEQVFARWSRISGINYVFQASDDGVALGTANGQLGVRGDIRIGGHTIDGNGGVLAYNFFPEIGDMVIDTSDSFFSDTSSNSLGLRNVLAHEHGHGLGFEHVCPVNETKLMEPFVSFAFDGPQHDDLRAVQRLYGDAKEKAPGPNDTISKATNLGTLGTIAVNDVSIDGTSDVDIFSFKTTASGDKVTISLRPTGTVYPEAAQVADGSCTAGTNIDSRSMSNLSLELLAANGTSVLALANATGVGGSEQMSNFALPAGTGPFFVRVKGDAIDNVQTYQLNLAVNLAVQPGPSYTVTTTSDHDDGVCSPSDCSLREAITEAQKRTSATISFASTVRGAINLASALPEIITSLTINGPGANLLTLRRSGSGLYPVLTSRGPSVTIAGLNLAKGNATLGGGILHKTGALTVRECALTGNSAVNGGGIYSEGGTLTVIRSLLEGNTATEFGGGITSRGVVVLENCTVSGNIAAVNGGALSDWDGDETFTLRHCTVVRNKVVTTGATSNSLSGGFDVFGTTRVTMMHSILALNTGNGVANNYNGPGITSAGFNLCSTAPPGLTSATDLRNVADPIIGALAANGGPTRTVALLAGSPAINGGNASLASPPETDQRGLGFPRVQGGRIDIGAFEAAFSAINVSVSNATSVREGSAAAPGSALFTITLSAPSANSVSVTFQTANSTALAGQDYVAKSGTLSFAPGETSKAVSVVFIGDDVAELNEAFFFDLKTVSGATISDGRGNGSIANDDGPQISIDDAPSLLEGNSSSRSQIFTVRLSMASTNTITVKFATANSTADTSDYVAVTGTLTFNPGETSKTIAVAVKGDTSVEPNESYRVVLSNATFARIADGTAVGVILNDDVSALLAPIEDEPSS
jgi:CSLREA domain-containing protein